MRRYSLLLAMCLSIVAACGPMGGGTTPPPGPDPEPPESRTEELLLPGSFTPTLVTYWVVDDLAIFGGDVVIGHIDPDSGELALLGTAPGELPSQGAGVASWSHLWPGRVIPYGIDDGIPADQKQHVRDAIAHWEAHTSLDFVERTSSSPQSLLFTGPEGGLDPEACFAHLGASSESKVWLGAGCGFRAIVHAIGHSVGMYHEHQRHDRNEHIEVIEQNVREGFLNVFGKLPQDLSVLDYDYDSVMHDTAEAFLRPEAPAGAVTMRVLTPGQEIGTGAGLSVGDIATVEAMYSTDHGPGPNVHVNLEPTAVELAPGETTQFTATVTGASDSSVTWSTTGGEIESGTESVTYTAPLEEGTFTVTATSVEDPTARDTATVNVFSGPSEPRYAQEELSYFEEIAVGSEYGPDGWIARWEEDILLKVEGTPTSEDLASLDRVIGELNILIQPIRIQIVDESPNMRMHFVPVHDFSDFEPNYEPGNHGFFTFRFLGLLGPENRKHLATIYESTVLVSSTEITQQHRSHLIREELTQALGLGNDSSAYPESIFYHGHTTTTEFLDIDRTVVEMLYRRELTSDMTTSEVLSKLAELRRAPNSLNAAALPDARRDPTGVFGLFQAGGD